LQQCSALHKKHGQKSRADLETNRHYKFSALSYTLLGKPIARYSNEVWCGDLHVRLGFLNISRNLISSFILLPTMYIVFIPILQLSIHLHADRVVPFSKFLGLFVL